MDDFYIYLLIFGIGVIIKIYLEIRVLWKREL